MEISFITELQEKIKRVKRKKIESLNLEKSFYYIINYREKSEGN